MFLQMAKGLRRPPAVSAIPSQAAVCKTAPLMMADGHVRIWGTDAIYNAADPNYAKPKQLASMSHHTGTIHAVRFSPNGRFLASGADDKIVCIYLLDTSAPSHSSTFGMSKY